MVGNISCGYMINLTSSRVNSDPIERMASELVAPQKTEQEVLEVVIQTTQGEHCGNAPIFS